VEVTQLLSVVPLKRYSYRTEQFILAESWCKEIENKRKEIKGSI
jgi:hypothetical protein